MRRWVAIAIALAACHRGRGAGVVVEIEVGWPGASAQEVAAGVATPLERQLGQLAHVVELTSASREGKTVVRVEIDGDPGQAWMRVQEAVGRLTAQLPRDLPAPARVRAVRPVVGRYLVASDKVRAETDAIQQHLDVTVETCGVAERQQELVLDTRALANMGVTVRDVVAAIHAQRTTDIPSVTIARHGGVIVSVRDVGALRDTEAPPECVVVTPAHGEVELTALMTPPVRPVAVHALAVPASPHWHGELDAALSPGAAAQRIGEAIGSDAAVAEIRGSELVVRGGTPALLQRLRQTAGVARIGERTATVHVSGADAHQVAEAARAIGDRLRAGDQLVATHGLATVATRTLDVDRDRAAQLGVTSDVIAETVAAAHGLRVATMFTRTDSTPLVLRVDDPSPDHLYVRANGDAEVPLASFVRVTDVQAPLEVLHRGQFPDVDLEVHGDPRAAIGSVPAGVRVEVEAEPSGGPL